jgi:glycosyltransferase involved in cell wall biosynthesis
MEMHVALLTSGLRPFVDVEVAVAAGNQPAGRETIGGVTVHRMPTLGVIASTPVCPDLFRVIREVRPDIVHIHHPHPMAMVGYLAFGTSVPCVVTYHSDIVRQRVLRRLAEPIVRETLRRSAAILVTSPTYLATSDVLQPFRDKCHVVPLGSDASNSTRVDRRLVAQLRARYGPRIVLGVGRLTHYKGFEYLVRAMDQIDARLLIVGEGPLRERLERLCSSGQLGGRVEMVGDVPSVAPYYEACDVFVLPSVTRNEAFGLVQLEAMAAGKPVVNTAVGSGVEYVCPPGVSALTVPPADVDALAGAIRRVLDDPALRRTLGLAGRARATTSEFSPATMVRSTLQIYEEVASGATVGRERMATRRAV